MEPEYDQAISDMLMRGGGTQGIDPEVSARAQSGGPPYYGRNMTGKRPPDDVLLGNKPYPQLSPEMQAMIDKIMREQQGRR